MPAPPSQLGQLLAATCRELPGPKESRRTAKDLWEAVVQMCSVSSQHKRGSDGRVSLIKQRDCSLGIMYRCVGTVGASSGLRTPQWCQGATVGQARARRPPCSRAPLGFTLRMSPCCFP